MDRFVRTASTRRLLTALLLAGALIAGGAAIAVAAAGGGPVPKREPLATALHSALTAPEPRGVSARISFTNHLIDSSLLQGADPLLTGGHGRLWISPQGRLRIELQQDGGDGQLVVDQNAFWLYDPAARTVYRGKLPTGGPGQGEANPQSSPRHYAAPSVAQITQALQRLAGHLNLSGAVPGDIAGQPAYTLTARPRASGGLLGAVRLAWDALRGVPLRLAVYARGVSEPVLELKVTDISYGPLRGGDFSAAPRAGAKVVNVELPQHPGGAAPRDHHRTPAVTGAGPVAARLSFSLAAPASLAGLPRDGVELVGHGAGAAALITYGPPLGGVVVLERAASGGPKTVRGGGHDGREGQLSLPTVKVAGVTGQELDTALGTLIHFTRSGVGFTVLGSVAPAVARAAARGL